jgi:hypothetical protein
MQQRYRDIAECIVLSAPSSRDPFGVAPKNRLPKKVRIGLTLERCNLPLLPELMRIDPLIVFSHPENDDENGLRLARAKVAVKPD